VAGALGIVDRSSVVWTLDREGGHGCGGGMERPKAVDDLGCACDVVLGGVGVDEVEQRVWYAECYGRG
jgi:hypothetical protein